MSVLWPWKSTLMGGDSVLTVTPSGRVQSTEILTTAGCSANLSDCITWYSLKRKRNHWDIWLGNICVCEIQWRALLWAACGRCLWWTERDQIPPWPFLWWGRHSHLHQSRKRNTWRHNKLRYWWRYEWWTDQTQHTFTCESERDFSPGPAPL